MKNVKNYTKKQEDRFNGIVFLLYEFYILPKPVQKYIINRLLTEGVDILNEEH